MECIIKGLRLNYEVVGSGKPIVMIHGYYPDHRLMTGCMEPLFKNESNYKRIYIDLPGMGQSESADWITNSDIMLDIVIQFIEKIIPKEKFLLIGESYGGYIARGIINKMQDRIDGLALICPLIIPNYSDRNVPEHMILERDERLLSKLSAEEAEDFEGNVVVQNEKIYKRYKEEVMTGVKIANSGFLQNIMKNGSYGFSFDVDKLNKIYDKPTVMLLGKQDDCMGYKDAWNILDNYSRAAFAILDKAGHNLQIEQEDLFNSLMKEWLVRVKEN